MKRFWTKVSKSEDGCWLWLACKIRGGYGLILYEGRNQVAHRVAWMLTNGPIPDRMILCHRCDVPACVNPAHLFLGSAQDNSDDMVAKGRSAKGRSAAKNPARGERWHAAHPPHANHPAGERAPHAKLSDAQAAAVKSRRMAGERGSDLAREYGVTQATICDIVKGRTRRAP